MPHTALFVVDIQTALANSATEIPHAARIRQAAETILGNVRGRANDIGVFIVQHEETPESGDLVHGTTPWELVFQPQGNEKLVSKHTGRSFYLSTKKK